MKKLIRNFALIMFLGLLLLTVGCGGTTDYYNLSPWSPPADPAFTSFVNSMNHPSKIASWMYSNCTYQIHTAVFSPYEFWTKRWGDCSEYAVLSSYVGHKNGYATYQTYILYTTDKAHRICIYDMGANYYYTSTGHYYYGGTTFKACIDDWARRKGITVASYVVYNWAGSKIESVNLSEIISRGIYDGE